MSTWLHVIDVKREVMKRGRRSKVMEVPAKPNLLQTFRYHEANQHFLAVNAVLK